MGRSREDTEKTCRGRNSECQTGLGRNRKSREDTEETCPGKNSECQTGAGRNRKEQGGHSGNRSKQE